MSSESINKPSWTAELIANVIAAGNLGDNFPTAALVPGGAVGAATAGSFEALQAGNAAAVGYLKFLEQGTGAVVYIVTAKPA